MRSTRLWCMALMLALSTVLCPAEVEVSLRPVDGDGVERSGPFLPGETVTIEVLLAATGIDDPLFDVRGIGFDFTAADDSIVVGTFAWDLDLPEGDQLYFVDNQLPAVGAAYVNLQRVEGYILDLTAEPVRVATLEAVLLDTGTLDVGVSELVADGGAWVQAGFTGVLTYVPDDGSLVGGTLLLEVSDEPPPDDGDDNPDDGNANDNVPGDPGDEPVDNDNVAPADNDNVAPGDDEPGDPGDGADDNDNVVSPGNGNLNDNAEPADSVDHDNVADPSGDGGAVDEPVEDGVRPDGSDPDAGRPISSSGGVMCGAGAASALMLNLLGLMSLRRVAQTSTKKL